MRPPPYPPVAEQRAVGPAVDANVILLRLEDAVASLRTGLMVVGVIAVAALGVAIYALVDTTGTSGAAAGNGRVAALEDRVDRIDRELQSQGETGGDSAALEDRVAALERTVKELADRPTPGDATEAVKELSERIDDVAGDVEQLEHQTQTTP